MKVFTALLMLFVTACATPVDAQDARSLPMPDWWVAHVDFMSRGGGVWVASNPGNATDSAQPDAFAMEWRAANNNHVLVGLYGIEAGVETIEFWSFREFWHPGEQRVVLQQWGGPGVFGSGYVAMDENRGAADQTFWLPDGRSWREGHRTVEEGDTYVTESFDIDAAGNWTANNTFMWTRTPR